MDNAHDTIATTAPFDAAKLDRLMDEAGLDVLIATSRHNVQYLLGGYRFFFFDVMEAIGTSRYLPVFVYQKGHPENAIYIGNRMEKFEHDLGRIWTPLVRTGSWGTIDAMGIAIDHVRKLGAAAKRVGIEASFLPADARRSSACRARRCRTARSPFHPRAASRRQISRRDSISSGKPLNGSSMRCWRRSRSCVPRHDQA